MNYIDKYGIKLRYVNVNDAAFILILRNDPTLNVYLSKTSNNISDQVRWIENYKLREANNEEYYFITEDLSGIPFGTYRLYNIEQYSFEIGSWLFSPDSPQGMAVKADIICKEFGFESLKADYCRFEVRKLNSAVVRYHQRFQPDKVREDELNFYYQLTREKFEQNKKKILNLF
jgi:RimJ/RimL family protein N-acetyltransferase